MQNINIKMDQVYQDTFCIFLTVLGFYNLNEHLLFFGAMVDSEPKSIFLLHQNWETLRGRPLAQKMRLDESYHINFAEPI